MIDQNCNENPSTKAQRKFQRRYGDILIVSDQGTSYNTVSYSYGSEATLLESQQHGCLNKICRMTIPVDRPKWIEESVVIQKTLALYKELQAISTCSKKKESGFFKGDYLHRLFNPKLSALLLYLHLIIAMSNMK